MLSCEKALCLLVVVDKLLGKGNGEELPTWRRRTASWLPGCGMPAWVYWNSTVVPARNNLSMLSVGKLSPPGICANCSYHRWLQGLPSRLPENHHCKNSNGLLVGNASHVLCRHKKRRGNAGRRTPGCFQRNRGS